MTTEATVSDIPAIVDEEASRRVEGVAAVAAAQVDQANKDAEAIARAAAASELGSRINNVEQENASWRVSMETRLTEATTAAARQTEELKALILANNSPPPPPPVEPLAEAEPASVSDEPKPNSPPQDTTTEPKKKSGLFQLRPLRKVL